MTIEMKSRKASDVVILDLPGRLSAFERTLWLRINEFINNGERHFVLNLSDIDYLDAGGLGQLVSVWTLVRSSGGWVTLLHPRKRVRSLLELTKLDTIFEIFDQEIQAVSRGHTKPMCPLRAVGSNCILQTGNAPRSRLVQVGSHQQTGKSTCEAALKQFRKANQSCR